MGATQKVYKSQFVDIEGKKSQNYIPTFENLNYQQTESKISYSPIRR